MSAIRYVAIGLVLMGAAPTPSRAQVAVGFVVADPDRVQDNSLIARALRNAGEISVEIYANTPLGTMDDLLTESTVVLTGVVRSAKPHLSRDNTSIWTAYEIQPTHTYLDRRLPEGHGRTNAPIIVDYPGGALYVDGLHLATHYSEYGSEDRFEIGESVMLFLSGGPDDAYLITRGPFGVFRVINERLVQLSRPAVRRSEIPKDLVDFELWLEKATAK